MVLVHGGAWGAFTEALLILMGTFIMAKSAAMDLRFRARGRKNSGAPAPAIGRVLIFCVGFALFFAGMWLVSAKL